MSATESPAIPRQAGWERSPAGISNGSPAGISNEGRGRGAGVCGTPPDGGRPGRSVPMAPKP
jgi:hypothetical protein